MANIKALIFDLDGTLYRNDELGEAINDSAYGYLAEIKGLDSAGSAALLETTRERLVASKRNAALSHSILELGGNLCDLHTRFVKDIHPEKFLGRDEYVVEMLQQLSLRFDLYIYTNNNRRLTSTIMELLGVTHLFRQVFTIEDFWRPKPDRGVLEHIFATIGRQPAECLFIGDRHDVDLRLPAEMGSPVFAVNSIEELLSLAKFITKEDL